MNFASYALFRTAVQTVIDGDDISQSSISTAVLDLIIGAGEQRVYRDVRSSTQDASFSITISENLAPLPADCMEVSSVYFPNFPSLTYEAFEVLQTNLQLGTNSTSANARRFSLQGDSLIFDPAQADGAIVLGQYYKRFPDIVTGLNTFFNRFPDLFMYAALAESAPYIGEVIRLPEWKERYVTIAQSANEFERRRASRGSKLATRRG